MNENEIFEVLKSILKNDVGIDITIELDTALIGSGHLDSMDFMSYITYIEEKFNIKISDKDIENNKLGIIKNMVAFLISK